MTASARPHPKGRPYATRAGVWVRSAPEQRIADWLAAHGVPFEYEPRVAGLRPDFVLRERNVVIEYWGGAGYRDYAARMVEKTARYEEAGWRVVHIVPVNLWELDRVLTAAVADSPPGAGRSDG